MNEIKDNERKQRIMEAIWQYSNSKYYENDRMRHYRDKHMEERRRQRISRMANRTEHEEQCEVVEWLKANGILFAAIPNGSVYGGDGVARARQANYMKSEGLVRGAPDLILFSVPPNRPDVRGVAIEMKSLTGRLQQHQEVFGNKIRLHQWVYVVGRGASDTLRQLKELGYG